MDEKMITIQLTVTQNVYKKLKELRSRTGNPLTTTIRIAIDEYLKHNTPEK